MLTQPGANLSTAPTAPEPDDQPEVVGDLDAPDIVSPTGEEMPVQTHDEVGNTSDSPSARPLQREPLTGRPTEGTPKRIG